MVTLCDSPSEGIESVCVCACGVRYVLRVFFASVNASRSGSIVWDNFYFLSRDELEEERFQGATNL